MSAAPVELHVEIDQAGASAVDVLAQASALSKQKIKLAMARGAVWLTVGTNTKRLRRAKKTPVPGSTLHLYYDPGILEEQPLPAELVADEHRYSVWYKPYGMLSQGSKWGDHCALYRWVEQNVWPARKSYIVHRLDRAATGLMLLAHDKKAASALAALFERRAMKKSYRVMVHGHTPASLTMRGQLDERAAITHAKLIAYAQTVDCSLLDIDIETGRKHQIRRHLAAAGFPVVGDRLYGRPEDLDNLQLTACRLQFECPLTSETKEYRLNQALLPAL